MPDLETRLLAIIPDGVRVTEEFFLVLVREYEKNGCKTLTVDEVLALLPPVSESTN